MGSKKPPRFTRAWLPCSYSLNFLQARSAIPPSHAASGLAGNRPGFLHSGKETSQSPGGLSLNPLLSSIHCSSVTFFVPSSSTLITPATLESNRTIREVLELGKNLGPSETQGRSEPHRDPRGGPKSH